LTSTKRRYRGRKSDKLQGAGAAVIAIACMAAGSLLEEQPLLLGTAILAGMVLVGGYLVWLGTR